MKRTRIFSLPEEAPDEIRRLAGDADIYDSSCSTEARVYFIDRDGGYYLKRAPCRTLCAEAEMTAYFHKKGLGAAVLDYRSGEVDWLLTERVAGEDCTYASYLDDPKRLADTIATELRRLHELDFSFCPVGDRMSGYIATVEENYKSGNYDKSYFPDNFGYADAEDAIEVFRAGCGHFERNVLLHGDYCLPNIMLDSWKLSGFIDLGAAGVGDRHVDLFWGAWTLGFNLGTDQYRERFFDAYGRDKINAEMLRVVAAVEVFG